MMVETLLIVESSSILNIVLRFLDIFYVEVDSFLIDYKQLKFILEMLKIQECFLLVFIGQ